MPAGPFASADRIDFFQGRRVWRCRGRHTCFADGQDGDVGKIQSGRKGGVNHLPQRVHVVGGDPFEKRDHGFRKKRRVVEHIQDMLDLHRINLIGWLHCRADQVSGDRASAKGHQDPFSRTGKRGQMRRNAVAEGVMDRQGHGHRNDMPVMNNLIFLDRDHGFLSKNFNFLQTFAPMASCRFNAL